jgi:FMN phosphatase YigB (HAD superfamily)
MALMVGDSLEWDYNPAVQNGIQAVLIKTDYAHERAKSIRRTIEKLEDISAYL